jgi:predicted P-loop ATPase
MLTLDVDSAKPTFLEEYTALSPYATLIYSTHSHTPEAPRLRLVIPLKRDVTPDEYQAITRLLAAEWDISQFDPCSFIPSQLMFWPTTPSDGEYVFTEVEGAPLDPDVFLSKYPDWRDPTKLPTTLKEAPLHERSGQKVEDPVSKEGIVGTFCRAIGTIQNAIDTYLEDVYESTGPNRYKYIPSSSIAGVQIYDDKWAYSNHATDPAYHQECNAFDLIRLHHFPDEDEKRSFQQMAEWAASLPEVSRLLLEEKQTSAQMDFSLPEDTDWKEALDRDKKGNVINSLRNLGLIMTYDEEMRKIVFNKLADSMEIRGTIPWSHEDTNFWRDADDAQLIWYVDQNYGSFSQRNYDIAVTKCVDDRSYHPIRDYFASLPEWDKTPRVDTLLIDYLGAEDTPYVRAVTRKMLCGAVARIYHPGIKFDTMLVLNGPQGIGKSTLISRLAMEWFSDSLTLSDMNDGKTAPEKLQGYWIHEIGEMAGMKKAEVEKVKSFISRQDDKYRAAFGHRVTSHPRQCIFFGTTNAENGFLRDVTGNRRFWPVTTLGGNKKHPWDLTQNDVDLLWAEAMVLYEAGEKLYLPAELEELAKKEQSAAMESDEREGLVRLYLETPLPENWSKMDLYQRREFLDGDDPTMQKGTVKRETVSNMEIWCECFRNTRESMRTADSFAIRSIMSRIEGWERANQFQKSKLYGKQQVYKRL